MLLHTTAHLKLHAVINNRLRQLGLGGLRLCTSRASCTGEEYLVVAFPRNAVNMMNLNKCFCLRRPLFQTEHLFPR